MNYKHASGAEKRKKRKQQEEEKTQLPKITQFFTPKESESEILTAVAETENVEEVGSSFAAPSENFIEIKPECTNSPNPNATIFSESICNKIECCDIANSEKPICDASLKLSKWTKEIIKTDTFIENIIKNKPKSDSVECSEKTYTDGDRTYYRSLKETDFYRSKPNGVKENREWLIYDSSVKRVYCYPCKLFSTEISSLSDCGYGDWKNLSRTLKNHEESKHHVSSMVTLATRTSLVGSVDVQLSEKILDEEKYWGKVLKRILATVKFLSQQGIAFRGSNENLESEHRGNYLSCLVYLSEFDDFLAEHLRRYGNKGKGLTSYLSHHICDEFIQIISDKIKNVIINEIKIAKYFSIIIDSTPDISHCDQLTFIIRYVFDGEVKERFVGFRRIERHTADYLEEMVLSYLKQLDLNIENCCGQSYDNAANMSGKYNGLQARIRTISPTAIYVPCMSHSLNLVLNFACEKSFEAVEFFNFIQNIYTFFSSSTHRWEKLKELCDLLPKRLSDTRWSARHDATRSLNQNYKHIYDILVKFSQDENEKPLTRNEALALVKKMKKFETTFLTVIWSKLLERIDATSKTLQDPTLNLTSAVQLLHSLLSFIVDFREKFDQLETTAKNCTVNNSEECLQYKDESKRVKRRKMFADETKEHDTEFRGRQNFKINVFYLICDSLVQELNKRMESYSEIDSCFKCFFTENNEDINKSLTNICEKYRKDIDATCLPEEFEQFKILCNNTHSENLVEKFKQVLGVRSTFPNITTILEILLTIPISNASAERSFSVLKRVKTYLRSTMGQEKLEALSLLQIESHCLKKLNTDDIIKTFAKNKARKKFINL